MNYYCKQCHTKVINEEEIFCRKCGAAHAHAFEPERADILATPIVASRDSRFEPTGSVAESASTEATSIEAAKSTSVYEKSTKLVAVSFFKNWKKQISFLLIFSLVLSFFVVYNKIKISADTLDLTDVASNVRWELHDLDDRVIQNGDTIYTTEKLIMYCEFNISVFDGDFIFAEMEKNSGRYAVNLEVDELFIATAEGTKDVFAEVPGIGVFKFAEFEVDPALKKANLVFCGDYWYGDGGEWPGDVEVNEAFLFLSCEIDKSISKNKDEYNIEFPGMSAPLEVNILNNHPVASIEKTGSFIEDGWFYEWKLVVDPGEDPSLFPLTVEDYFDRTIHGYVPDSLRIKGQDPDTIPDFTWKMFDRGNDTVIEITIPEKAVNFDDSDNNKIEITFTTQLSAKEFTGDKYDEYTQVRNEVYLYDGDDTEIDYGLVDFFVPPDKKKVISKYYNGSSSNGNGNNTYYWNAQITMPASGGVGGLYDMVFSDNLPEGMILVPGSLNINWDSVDYWDLKSSSYYSNSSYEDAYLDTFKNTPNGYASWNAFYNNWLFSKLSPTLSEDYLDEFGGWTSIGYNPRDYWAYNYYEYYNGNNPYYYWGYNNYNSFKTNPVLIEETAKGFKIYFDGYYFGEQCSNIVPGTPYCTNESCQLCLKKMAFGEWFSANGGSYSGKYNISYQTMIDPDNPDVFLKNSSNGEYVQGSSVGNKAKITYDYIKGKDPLPEFTYDVNDVYVDNNLVVKYGNINYSDPYYVDWRISVNPNKLDFKEAILTDRFGYYYNSSGNLYYDQYYNERYVDCMKLPEALWDLIKDDLVYDDERDCDIYTFTDTSGVDLADLFDKINFQMVEIHSGYESSLDALDYVTEVVYIHDDEDSRKCGFDIKIENTRKMSFYVKYWLFEDSEDKYTSSGGAGYLQKNGQYYNFYNSVDLLAKIWVEPDPWDNPDDYETIVEDGVTKILKRYKDWDYNSVYISSNTISKSSQYTYGYDPNYFSYTYNYEDNSINWWITVNSNKINMPKGTKVTDALPDYMNFGENPECFIFQESYPYVSYYDYDKYMFKDETNTYTYRANNLSTGGVFDKFKDPRGSDEELDINVTFKDSNKTLEIQFGEEAEDEVFKERYYILIKTYVDTEKCPNFKTDKTFTVSNTVEIERPDGIKDSYTAKVSGINNKAISKSAVVEGNNKITYTVGVNGNGLIIGPDSSNSEFPEGCTVSDKIPEGLKLDTGGEDQDIIRFYKGLVSNSGIITKGDQITDLEAEGIEWSYELTTNDLSIAFTKEGYDKCVVIEYTCFAVTAGTYKNEALLQGKGITEDVGKASTSQFLAGGGGTVLPKAKLQITKLDADTDVPLDGVEFELWTVINGVDTCVDRGTTNSFGVLTFNLLSPSRTYQIIETSAKEGYAASTAQIIYNNGVSIGEISVLNADGTVSGGVTIGKGADDIPLTGSETATVDITNKSVQLKPVELTLKGTKNFTVTHEEDHASNGTRLEAGAFMFTVTDVYDNILSTGTNRADTVGVHDVDGYGGVYAGAIDFSSIEFVAAGSYTLTVAEVNGGLSRYTYSDKVYTIEVRVIEEKVSEELYELVIDSVDINDGGSLIDITADNGESTLEFDNKYRGVVPASVTVQFNGLKSFLDGHGDVVYVGATQFSFIMEELNEDLSSKGTGIVAVGSNAVPTDGNVNSIRHSEIIFSPITYTEEDFLNGAAYTDPANPSYDLRKFYYRVTEVDTGIPGVVYDKIVHVETVTVRRYTDANDDIVLEIYNIGDVDGECKCDHDHDDVDFNQNVFKPDNSILDITGEYNVCFINAHYAEPVNVVINGRKQFNDPDGNSIQGQLEAGMFSFIVKDEHGNTVSTATNKKNGDIEFSKLHFEAPGTYSFIVKEVMPVYDPDTHEYSGNWNPYIKYDPTPHTITVEVTEEVITAETQPGIMGLKSVLVANIIYDNSKNKEIVFVNEFEEDGDKPYNVAKVTITGEKWLYNSLKDDYDFIDEDMFSFVIEDMSDNVVAVGVNSAGTPAMINFGSLWFTDKGWDDAEDSRTYTYKAREIDGNLSGYIYDNSLYYFDVTVNRVRDGSNNVIDLTVTYTYRVVYDINNNEIQENYKTIKFTNYDGIIAYQPTVRKELIGETLKEGQFHFVLTDSSGSVISTAVNDEDGEVKFPLIYYNQRGIYNYKIMEVDGNDPDTIYDNTVYSFSVAVSDFNSDNVLEYEENLTEQDPVFHNKKCTVDTKLNLSGTKVFEGNDGISLDIFRFEVYDTGKGFAQNGGNLVSIGVPDSSGKIAFTPIQYYAQGTHYYRISETIGKIANMTYDPSVYYLEVTIDASGNITAKMNKDTTEDLVAIDVNSPSALQSGLLFDNQYVTERARVPFNANKILEGKTLEDGMFVFVVEKKNDDGSWTEVLRQKNYTPDDEDDHSKVRFGTIVYDKAGEYEYRIREIEGDDDNITYDAQEYCFKVVVENDNGVLKGKKVFADLTEVDDDEIVFTNIYDEPEQTTAPDTSTEEDTTDTTDENTTETDTTAPDTSTDDVTTETDTTVPDTSTDDDTTETDTTAPDTSTEDDTSDTTDENTTESGTAESITSEPITSEPITTETTTEEITTTTDTESESPGTDTTESESPGTDTTEPATPGTDTSDTDTTGTLSVASTEPTTTPKGTEPISKQPIDTTPTGTTNNIPFITTAPVITPSPYVSTAPDDYPPFIDLIRPGPVRPPSFIEQIDLMFVVHKSLNGAAMKAGMFSFVLKDENGKIVSVGINDADGTVRFGSIFYTKAGVYEYTVSEVNSGGGHQYDEKVYPVTVIVREENGFFKGEVKYSVPNGKDYIEFNNKWDDKSIPVTFTGRKILENNAMLDKMFSFVVVDEDDKIVSVGTNDAGGNVKFGNFYCNIEGGKKYKLKILEIGGEAIGVNYDKSVLDLQVEFKEVNGVMTGSVVNSNELLFTNTFISTIITESTRTTDTTRTTSTLDTNPRTNVSIIITGTMISLGALVVAVLLRRRKKNER